MKRRNSVSTQPLIAIAMVAAFGVTAFASPAFAQAGAARATPPTTPATTGAVAPRPAIPSEHEPRTRAGRSLTGTRAAPGIRPNVAHPPNVGGGPIVRHLPGPFTRLRVHGAIFYYCLGSFYTRDADGYELVTPPEGTVVRSLPRGYETIELGERTLYYFDGVFYEAGKRRGEYVVVPAPVGAVVGHLPRDAAEVRVDGQLYHYARGVYYVELRRRGELAYVVTRP